MGGISPFLIGQSGTIEYSYSSHYLAILLAAMAPSTLSLRHQERHMPHLLQEDA